MKKNLFLLFLFAVVLISDLHAEAASKLLKTFDNWQVLEVGTCDKKEYLIYAEPSFSAGFPGFRSTPNLSISIRGGELFLFSLHRICCG